MVDSAAMKTELIYKGPKKTSWLNVGGRYFDIGRVPFKDAIWERARIVQKLSDRQKRR